MCLYSHLLKGTYYVGQLCSDGAVQLEVTILQVLTV